MMFPFLYYVYNYTMLGIYANTLVKLWITEDNKKFEWIGTLLDYCS